MLTQKAYQEFYPDINPCEVLEKKTEKCVVIRPMDATCIKSPTFVVGGFSGIAVDQHTQEWEITPNTAYSPIKVRLHKNNRWYDANGNRYSPSEKPIKFYDYNF